MFSFSQLSCSNCGRPIDIGEPFLATAIFPARSSLQSDAITTQYLQQNGEVLCASCAKDRIGQDALESLKGAKFKHPHHETSKRKK